MEIHIAYFKRYPNLKYTIDRVNDNFFSVESSFMFQKKSSNVDIHVSINL